MAVMQTGGTAQTAQEQRRFDDYVRACESFAQAARRLTNETKKLIRMHNALGIGPEMGTASGDEYLTASSTARSVDAVRNIFKAAISYAAVRSDLSQAEADAILQQAFGNDTETTVPPDQIVDLVNQWV